MNQILLKKTYLLFLGIGSSIVYAQKLPVASGGDASGSGGSVAYSVGQIVYTTVNASTGSASQGIQQTYSISVVTGIDQTDININLSAYPNPVTELLVLKITEMDLKNLSYTLYDITGKLIESKNISNSETRLNMLHLPVAGYILKVSNNNHPIKTFQIIKN